MFLKFTINSKREFDKSYLKYLVVLIRVFLTLFKNGLTQPLKQMYQSPVLQVQGAACSLKTLVCCSQAPMFITV